MIAVSHTYSAFELVTTFEPACLKIYDGNTVHHVYVLCKKKNGRRFNPKKYISVEVCVHPGLGSGPPPFVMF